LKPEKAWNYEGGVDWYPRERWHFSATVFERRERDDIDYVRANPAAVWQATNFDRLNFRGVEVTMALSLPCSQLLEIQFTGIRGASAALNGLQSKYVFNYPAEQGVVAWQRTSKRGWLARVRMGVANQYQRDSYVLVDASAAWTRSWLHPYARVTNVTNTYYEPVYGVPMPGRAALVGLEICAICRGK
jgi:iron complex outermembrane receptor protein